MHGQGRQETVARERLARDLRQAIHENCLNVVYQPIMDVSGEKMLGVEALCRWRHPVLGDVPPPKFIQLAEDVELIAPLGEWVLRRACLDARAWPGIKLAVNVSPRQFTEPNFIDIVGFILAETNIEPSRLELELTESLFLDNLINAREKMRALRAIGASLALDDFGAGYSSLNYLVSLPFQKLKIDRSFVMRAADDARGAAIVHAIVSLGRALGMHVTAEGVETAEQHKFLRVAGVHSLQGYRFSRPVDAETITARLYAQAALETARLQDALARAG